MDILLVISDNFKPTLLRLEKASYYVLTKIYESNRN